VVAIIAMGRVSQREESHDSRYRLDGELAFREPKDRPSGQRRLEVFDSRPARSIRRCAVAFGSLAHGIPAVRLSMSAKKPSARLCRP